MIKNTTITPHRSLYIPDHSQFALGIMGKYQYTTDNYLGLLGLTFRENLATEALDAAPIYRFLIHLRLQILQLQHANNLFIRSGSATLQMLHNKLNTNIELQQINQLLSQHVVRERESAHNSTGIYEGTAQKNPKHLTMHHSQIWNSLLEKMYTKQINKNSLYFADKSANTKLSNSYLKKVDHSLNLVIDKQRSAVENHYTNNLQPELSIQNLFYKRMHESTNFVQAILTKQAYSQNEIKTYNETTEIKDNRVSQLPDLQLTIRKQNFEAGSVTNDSTSTSTILQINHILLKNLNNKNNLYKTELSVSSVNFADALIHMQDDSSASNRAEFNTKLILMDRKQHNQVTKRDALIDANRVYLKPNFLYTDAISQVYQQFRRNHLYRVQVFEAIRYPDSPIQLTNRLFTNRIVQEHMNEQKVVMQLNPTHLTHQTLASFPIEVINEYNLNKSVQLNSRQLEQQSVLNHNFMDNFQYDLKNSIYNSFNSLQLIDHHYSTNLALSELNRIQQSKPLLLTELRNTVALGSAGQALRHSTILQQFKQQLNRQTYLYLNTPHIHQKFSLTQSRTQLQEKEIKQTLKDVRANMLVAIVNNSNFIEKAVQAHINNWSSQIQIIPITTVNHLLDQVENETRNSFNEMNSNPLQIYNQALTLVERKGSGSDNKQKLIVSKRQERISILQQSKDIIQKAIFLKLKTRELQKVNKLEKTISSGLNPELIQQLWLNNKVIHQAAAHIVNRSLQIQPDLVTQIIRNRIGDTAQIIHLNSTQLNNQLLYQANNNNKILFRNAAPITEHEAAFSNTHFIKLVDLKQTDPELMNKTLFSVNQQVIQHKTDLLSLLQQFQAVPDNLSFALKQLNTDTSLQSIVNIYKHEYAGPAMSVMTSLSPLIIKKYSLHLLDARLAKKPLKRSLNQVIIHKAGALEHTAESIDSNNLAVRIVNQRIHSQASLIMQIPISASNLLLHQLNMDNYSRAELDQQIEHTQNQNRLELVDRKVIERGSVVTINAKLIERVNDQIRIKEINLKTAVLVALEKYSTQQSEQLFIQNRAQSRNLIQNSRSKVTNEAYVTSIINNFQRLAGTETNQISYLRQNLTAKIISERIGEVTSVLQLIPDHHENLLLYANHPVMAINQLIEKNTLLIKGKSSLRLIDRKLIDRGLQAAVAIIMLQRGAEQRAELQMFTNGSNELLNNKTVNKQTVPILHQVINQLNDPALEQQYIRRLSQSTSQYININNRNQSVTQQNEMTHSAQLMTLTNGNQISTQAQFHLITQAQQELEQQLLTVDAITETTTAKARPHLKLEDRNHMDHTMVQTITEKLLRQGIRERTRPEVLIDRTNAGVVQFRTRESPFATSFRAAETNFLFREQPTKKIVKAQINDILTQANHSVSMQSLQKNQVNQRFIDKVMTHLLIANEREKHNERNNQNESLERILSTNNESLIVNRRPNQEAAEYGNDIAVLMAQSEMALEYLKTKSNTAEPIQQSVANVLKQNDQMYSQTNESNGKVSPITKLEFDKIVDRVYRELQKRFTNERQRRGM